MLFLPYVKLWDMPLGGSSSEKQVPHWFGNIAWAIVGGAFKLCFRYRVDGRENLRGFKGKSGVMVICNHTSYLDVVFMWLASRPAQWLRIMGRESLFDNGKGLAGQILSRVGAFPVKRDSADLASVKRAARMLRDDELVGVLPEGTRRGKGSQTPELHGGAALIARMGKAPILPMTVRNAEKIKEKGKFIRFPKVTIEYGHPIVVSDFNFLPKEDRLDACIWYAMRECFALSQRIAAEKVDMKSLFPSNKDYSETFAAHPLPTHTTEELTAKE